MYRDRTPCMSCGERRGKVPPAQCRHPESHADAMWAALRDIELLHFEVRGGGTCWHDGEGWPCLTVRILAGEEA